MLSQRLRALDFTQGSERADLSSLLAVTDALQFVEVPEIEYAFRFE